MVLLATYTWFEQTRDVHPMLGQCWAVVCDMAQRPNFYPTLGERLVFVWLLTKWEIPRSDFMYKVDCGWAVKIRRADVKGPRHAHAQHAPRSLNKLNISDQ